jgi:hypothetical protein
MKAFFGAYTGLEKLAPLVREIGWNHNLVTLERFKDPLEREFYLRMTRKFGWSEKCRAGQDHLRGKPVHPVTGGLRHQPGQRLRQSPARIPHSHAQTTPTLPLQATQTKSRSLPTGHAYVIKGSHTINYV